MRERSSTCNGASESCRQTFAGGGAGWAPALRAAAVALAVAACIFPARPAAQPTPPPQTAQPPVAQPQTNQPATPQQAAKPAVAQPPSQQPAAKPAPAKPAAAQAGPETASVSQAVVRLPAVKIYLDVPDASGKAAPTPAPSALAATLGGAPLAVSSVRPFADTGEGVAVIFLLDVSSSLGRGEFDQLKAAVKAWAASARAPDRMALLAVGSGCRVVQDFTSDKAAIAAKLDSLAPADDRTLLHQGLAKALELARRADPGLPDRRAIVVLGDGKDEGSGLSDDDIVDRFRVDRTPVYAVGSSRLPGAERRQRLDVLHRFAAGSGGVYAEVDQKTPIAGTFAAMDAAVRRVFVVEAICADCKGDGGVQRLQVRLSDGARVLADGADVSAAPAPQQPQQPARAKPWWERTPAWAPAAGGAALVALGWLSAWLVRRRKRAEREEEARAEESRRRVDEAGGDDPPPADGEGGGAAPPGRGSAASTAGGLQVRLAAIAGPHRGESFRLALSDKAFLGRSAGCEVPLPKDDLVSGRHCALERSGGKAVLYDLGSRNGTSLNGVPVKGRNPLQHDDVVRLGQTEIRVVLEER